MEQMNDLRALLMHNIQMLQSAEEQIIEALPAMIEEAQNPALKQALQEHLTVSETQLERLDTVSERIGLTGEDAGKYTSALDGLMDGTPTCKGMEALIEEGEDLMAENLSPEVMDAAIIGCAQQIEHLEIAAYGTARTFAEQLGMQEVADLLQQTLDEEYEADQKLTGLATSQVNEDAQAGS